VDAENGAAVGKLSRPIHGLMTTITDSLHDTHP
jgi:hypothetical protein